MTRHSRLLMGLLALSLPLTTMIYTGAYAGSIPDQPMQAAPAIQASQPVHNAARGEGEGITGAGKGKSGVGTVHTGAVGNPGNSIIGPEAGSVGHFGDGHKEQTGIETVKMGQQRPAVTFPAGDSSAKEAVGINMHKIDSGVGGYKETTGLGAHKGESGISGTGAVSIGPKQDDPSPPPPPAFQGLTAPSDGPGMPGTGPDPRGIIVQGGSPKSGGNDPNPIGVWYPIGGQRGGTSGLGGGTAGVSIGPKQDDPSPPPPPAYQGLTAPGDGPGQAGPGGGPHTSMPVVSGYGLAPVAGTAQLGGSPGPQGMPMPGGMMPMMNNGSAVNAAAKGTHAPLTDLNVTKKTDVSSASMMQSPGSQIKLNPQLLTPGGAGVASPHLAPAAGNALQNKQVPAVQGGAKGVLIGL